MGSSCLCQQCPHAPSFTPSLLLEELPLFKAFALELILSDLMFISMTLGQTFPLVLYHFGCSSASSSYSTCFSFSIFFLIFGMSVSVCTYRETRDGHLVSFSVSFLPTFEAESSIETGASMASQQAPMSSCFHISRTENYNFQPGLRAFLGACSVSELRFSCSSVAHALLTELPFQSTLSSY